MKLLLCNDIEILFYVSKWYMFAVESFLFNHIFIIYIAKR